jgi:hypothetical protein
MKSALMKRWFEVTPKATPAAFTRLVRQAGWDGVLGEMFEERVGDVAKSAMGLQPWKDAIPTPEQLLVEAVSFSVPGAVANTGKSLYHRVAGQTSAVPARPGAPAPSATPDQDGRDSSARTVPGASPVAETTTGSPGTSQTSSGAGPRTSVSIATEADEVTPQTELVAREKELAALPVEAAPFHRALLQNRIGSLHSQVAQAPATASAPVSADTPQQTPQSSASEVGVARHLAHADPGISPAPKPASDPASEAVRPWGDIGSSDIGQTVVDRRGRRGTIYQVGKGGVVAARGADGKAFGIAPGEARVVGSTLHTPSLHRAPQTRPSAVTEGLVPQERAARPTRPSPATVAS